MNPERFRQILLGAFFCAGAACLGYPVAWARMLAMGLGQDVPALFAVGGAVLTGVALGAWILDRAIARSFDPGRWCGLLQLIAAGWGLVTLALVPWINDGLPGVVGAEAAPFRVWLHAYGVLLPALLPVTAAFGASLVAMERFLAPVSPQGRCVGMVFGALLLGAAAGVLVIYFISLRWIGIHGTLAGLVLMNFGVGVFLLRVVALEPRDELRQSSGMTLTIPRVRLALMVMVSGVLAAGFVWVTHRGLVLVLENTIYSQGIYFIVLLVGAAVGVLLYQHYLSAHAFGTGIWDLLCFAAFSCGAGMLALASAKSVHEGLGHLMGDQTVVVVFTEGVVTLMVVGLPAAGLGGLFSHLLQASQGSAVGVGGGLALYSVGLFMGAMLFCLWIVPDAGLRWAGFLVIPGLLLLLPQWLGSRPFYPVVALVTGCIGLGLSPVRFDTDDARVLAFHNGALASLAVIEDTRTNRSLVVNNQYLAGGHAFDDAERMQVHLPLLLHDHPRRVALLGLGSGISLDATRAHPDLQVTGVEPLPEVIHFLPSIESENLLLPQETNIQLFAADPRRFVRASEDRFDVVVSGLWHPARVGAGTLTTLEQLRFVRERLTERGLFCLWLPLAWLDHNSMRIVVRTFLEVFPESDAWLLRWDVEHPVIGLVGRLEPFMAGPGSVEQRLAHLPLREALGRLRLDRSVRVAGHHLAGRRALDRYAGQSAISSDNRPRIPYDSVGQRYRRDDKSYSRLMGFLRLEAEAGKGQHPWSTGAPEEFAFQLSAFVKAREAYLRGLVYEMEDQRYAALESFISSARLSEAFPAGYARALQMAVQQHSSNPLGARLLLERLSRTQATNPGASNLLRRFFPERPE